MAQILQDVPNNYETDLIYPLIQKAALLANIDYNGIDEKKKTVTTINLDDSSIKDLQSSFHGKQTSLVGLCKNSSGYFTMFIKHLL